ncbi:MAG: hypothetical protein L0271_20115, partial [Gemmatimonadetes bacterium]|nr:hypothetical protein [Gemmatimonadota bacterium]
RLRREAEQRMTRPASQPVLQVLDGALRDSKHHVVNSAGALAGSLGAIQTIPLLIFSQVSADAVPDTGNLAWIAIGTQEVFVLNVEPVVNNGVVAFEPVLGVVQEGVILRVVDAVAISYRIDVHDSLVAMTTQEMGRPTEYLGYDPKAWWTWYNDEFVPHMRRKVAIAKLAKEPKDDAPAATP